MHLKRIGGSSNAVVPHSATTNHAPAEPRLRVGLALDLAVAPRRPCKRGNRAALAAEAGGGWAGAGAWQGPVLRRGSAFAGHRGVHSPSEGVDSSEFGRGREGRMWQPPGVGPGRPQRETCTPSAAPQAAAAVLGHAGGAKTCCRAQPKQAGARGCNTQAATSSSPRGAALQPTQHADSRRPIVACRLRCPSDGGRSTGAPLKGRGRHGEAPSPACCVQAGTRPGNYILR